MEGRHKILWTEGMFLRPHHFQQADAYHARCLRMQDQQVWNWGFSRLVVDEGMLALGKVALHAASGRFPDGTAFEFEGAQDAPPVLDIAADSRALTLVLALPLQRNGRESVIFSERADSLARYLCFEKEVADDNAQSHGPATVHCGRLRLRLLPETQVNAEWMTLGALRLLEKDANGVVRLDEHYIPPLLNCRTSPVLSTAMQEISMLVNQRRQQLIGQLHSQPEGRHDSDLMLLRLMLIQRFSARIDHDVHLPWLHPEQLFSGWLPFALELCALLPTLDVNQPIPRYQHQQPTRGLSELMVLLRHSLSLVLEENALALLLTTRMPGLQVASLPASHQVDDFDFILAVEADIDRALVLSHLPTQLKVAPVNRIRELVQLQLPGIPLRRLPLPPRQLPCRSASDYFVLESGGELWAQIAASGDFAFYLAGDIADARLRFWAIRRRPDAVG